MNPSWAAPVFYYHAVAENSLSVKPAVFRAQLSYLKRHAYRSLTLSECLASRNNHEGSQKRLVLTFDDGFGSMWENVFPLLRNLGFQATFFIVPSYVGKTLWGDPATQRWSLDEKPGRIAFRMMNWDQISRLSEAGMEIGSHTLSHRNLTELSETEARREIRESKEYLEEKLGAPVRGFSYPRGRVNEVMARLVQESGYEYACTTQPGRATRDSDPFLLPRIPGPDTVSGLFSLIRGVPVNLFTRSALRLACRIERLRIRTALS
jgi:peptidoglycan/xylan/chitin deacetylase (PgdA/CDA1 family)